MPLIVNPTKFPDVKVLEPKLFTDERGLFYESFNHREFQQATGLNLNFVQDNHSKSKKDVLRGMHFQIKHPQGKLVRVVTGSVYDVVVDLRRASKQFGEWFAIELSEQNMKQLWIPPGYAHGFIVTSDTAEVIYKTTDYWFPEFERTLLWCDSKIAITWPTCQSPILSNRDMAGQIFENIEYYS